MSARRDPSTAVAPRTKMPLDTGWRFHLGDTDTALSSGLDDTDWEDVRLPHDWAIACPTDRTMEQGKAQGFQRRGHIGWYRRRFVLAPTPGRRVWLRLDGAYRKTELWINGQSLGKHPSGYAARWHDLIAYLRSDGEQLLVIRCDNSGHDGDRWYCGAGLYRRIWLRETDDVAVAPWGLFVTTPRVSRASASVRVEIAVRNHGKEAVCATIDGEIIDADGRRAALLKAKTIPVPPSRGSESAETEAAVAPLSATVPTPSLWSPESPSLYRVRIRIAVDGRPADVVEQAFGIRRIAFSATRGFQLNGVPHKLKGVCLHHDLGCLGAAFFAVGWERRLRLLKTLGCNAVRTSHNPPDPGLLDLCDRLGLFVIDEAFDKWKGGCGGDWFDAWWESELGTMIRRDRNHPSIVIWSIGNEVERQCQPDMLRICRRLAQKVRALDATRPVTVARLPHCEGDLWTAPVPDKVRAVEAVAREVDLVGLNYQDQWYEAYHAAMPDTVFVATEAFHFFQHRDNGSWAMHAENPWFEVARRPYVIGQFLWTGVDYLGEAAVGWPARGWTGALVDTAGFVKPRAWWHAAVCRDTPVIFAAARWRDPDAWVEPTDWSWPPLADNWNLPLHMGEPVEVWVFSNGQWRPLLSRTVPKPPSVRARGTLSGRRPRRPYARSCYGHRHCR